MHRAVAQHTHPPKIHLQVLKNYQNLVKSLINLKNRERLTHFCQQWVNSMQNSKKSKIQQSIHLQIGCTTLVVNSVNYSRQMFTFKSSCITQRMAAPFPGLGWCVCLHSLFNCKGQNVLAFSQGQGWFYHLAVRLQYLHFTFRQTTTKLHLSWRSAVGATTLSIMHWYQKSLNRLLKVCYVPTTSAVLIAFLFFFPVAINSTNEAN
jgi:hypothetical protein